VNRLYIFLAILGLLGIIGLGGYFYYKDTQKTITDLSSKLASSTAQIVELEATLAELEKDKVKQMQANKTLEVRLSKAEKYKENIVNILSKHDLTKLASAKPGLIENRINDGTKKTLEDIVNITSTNSIDN